MSSKALPLNSNSVTHHPPRIIYIDNIRILLTILVILHHALISYGAPGGWYYIEKVTQVWALIPMTLIVAINQSFFMGFFFFISAYFISSSYNKKGPWLFVLDRLKRLGIPLLFYCFILSPFFIYLVLRYGHDQKVLFINYVGVLWFVAALLLFTLIFAVVKIGLKEKQIKPIAVPSLLLCVVITIALGIVTFIVRIQFPVGWILDPVGFQLAHFSQYILMFCLGIIASRNHWLDYLNHKISRRLQIFVLVMVFVVFPAVYYINMVTNGSLQPFAGGLNWQSFSYSVWEQLVGISIIYILLWVAKQKWETSSPVLKGMSRASYGAYIFHPLMLICPSLWLQDWAVTPLFKLLIIAPVSIALSFLFSTLLVRIPIVKNII